MGGYRIQISILRQSGRLAAGDEGQEQECGEEQEREGKW